MAFRSAFAWFVFGQFLSFAIAFAGSPVIAHLLTPVDMGIYVIALATISVLATVAAFGVGTYVVRVTELGSATLASAFTVNAILAVAMATVIYLASFAERTCSGTLQVAQVLAPLALGPLTGASA